MLENVRSSLLPHHSSTALSTPFLRERPNDVQFALVREYAGVVPAFHARQCIAHYQLVGRERAITLAGRRLGNDAGNTS